MALRCLSSIKANNKIIYLTQFNQTAMTAIWETNKNDYAWYTNTSRPPIAPDQYVTSYGTDIMSDFYDNTWLSSGDENYTIDNANGSYMLKAYNSTVGPRNIVGISPYGYGPNDIWIRYPVNEISFFSLNIGIIIDDDTHQAIIVLRNRRYDPDNSVSAFDRLTLYSATTTRQTFYEAFFGAEPSQYTWQSVPSISGKNGILSLATLKEESINDGEPVSGAAVSVFDQAPSNGNNIKNLADTYGSGEESSAVDVTVKYKVTLPPGGVFDVLKLVAKKDSIPEDASDGDKIVDISPSKTKKTVTGLDENSMYYFKIFAEDSNGSTSESDEKHITTSGDEGWSFDYTGEIQTFVAPKTGIYQLETWGAQGGDASDGTLTARGGYGAYAVGEVLLTQGEKLYINVGGQNGYGGGGNADVIYTFEQLSKNLDFSHNKDYRNYSQGVSTTIDDVPSEYYGTDWMLTVGQMNITVPTYSNETISLAKSFSNIYCTGGVFMPIDRTYVKKLYLTLTINDGYRVSIGIGKIVSNEVETTELYYNTGTGSNIQLELDVNDDVDYLIFNYGQQAVTITDISFLC